MLAVVNDSSQENTDLRHLIRALSEELDKHYRVNQELNKSVEIIRDTAKMFGAHYTHISTMPDKAQEIFSNKMDENVARVVTEISNNTEEILHAKISSVNDLTKQIENNARQIEENKTSIVKKDKQFIGICALITIFMCVVSSMLTYTVINKNITAIISNEQSEANKRYSYFGKWAMEEIWKDKEVSNRLLNKFKSTLK